MSNYGSPKEIHLVNSWEDRVASSRRLNELDLYSLEFRGIKGDLVVFCTNPLLFLSNGNCKWGWNNC